MRLFKEMLIIALGAFAAIYLMYPSLGVFELIPDAVPILGSLDEASATLILLNTFRYYGVDLSRIFGKRDDTTQRLPPAR